MASGTSASGISGSQPIRNVVVGRVILTGPAVWSPPVRCQSFTFTATSLDSVTPATFTDGVPNVPGNLVVNFSESRSGSTDNEQDINLTPAPVLTLNTPQDVVIVQYLVRLP